MELKEAGYQENQNTIENINLSINKGELVGLIGPNGAGKSTIIKSILGLLNYMDGEVTIHDNKRYAYIPEHPTYYEELSLWEHIQLAKTVNQIESDDYFSRAEELLELFRLTKARHQLPSSFSKGMQQKLMIIIAILIQPMLYIVDEPFIGLDPKAIKDFLKILEEERKRGAAILMCTHVLDTAEKICDRFYLINNGQIIAQGTLQQLQDVSVAQGSLMDCFYTLMEESDDE
ncbi:ABC transporter ATP-binding protein [Alkalihalobacillus sp. LMS39]|uniref:ABC transporter ATP-binding protein n=1 Tax=Alkalihalobacillus sp. LMS39 TaxID=2924032 RepID=UPI001FB3CE02|nr:ABC transporter ATP-binding protein [Alkalihalobacillus sp. LMS39]UOE96252.1 ABC transporter ATP-binding protein [Alkalihalobacillus sp. LMS39]